MGVFQLGDLQRQKAAHYFELIDGDDNGLIEPADFRRRADRLAEAFGVTDADERDELRRHLMRWWEHLSTLADANDDGRVTREEWEMYWTRFKVAVSMGSRSRSTENLERVARATFRAIDRSGSGRVTADEFAAWLDAWDIDDHAMVFHRLDRDDTGVLTEQDLVEATREFYLSNDPEAPGTVLYGPLPDEAPAL
jgi:Ca2+-binding EF-hand superfamily protein